jgi:hypothetical protein
MRKLLLGLGLVLGAGAPAAGHAPFAPSVDAPDHVVTMVEREGYRQEEHSRIVSSHGRWARVEARAGNRLARAYFRRDGAATVRVSGGADEHHTVSILRGAEARPGVDRNPVNTHEQQSLLGESCTVWDVWRTRESAGYRLTRLSCVTDDGIELWYRIIDRRSAVVSSAEAIRIERRPVPAQEAEPPRDLTALEGWFPEPSPTSPQSDFETIMERTDLPQHRMTTRRHDGWTYVEKTFGEQRQLLTLSHPARGLTLRFQGDGTGAHRELIITKAPRPQPTGRFLPKETVLGETCRWLDMTPGVMDAGATISP